MQKEKEMEWKQFKQDREKMEQKQIRIQREKTKGTETDQDPKGEN